MDHACNQSDIVLALARSRAQRDARKRRRRRNVLLACAAVLLGGGTAVSIFGFNPGDAVEAAVGQAKSLAELLDQRSPGKRTAAELTKLKKAHRAAAKLRMAPHKAGLVPPVSPTAAALAKVLLPPAQPAETFAPVAMLDAGAPPTLGGIVGPPPSGGFFPSPGGVNITPPGGSGTPPGGSDTPPGGSTNPPGGGGNTNPPGGSSNPPGDGGSTNPPGGTTNPPGGTTNPPGGSITPPDGSIIPPGDGVTPPGNDTPAIFFPKDEPRELIPVTPVPEPGTWATMLLGFGLIGWRLRRRPKGSAKPRLA